MLGMFYKINEGRRILRIPPAALVSDISPSDGNCLADSRATKLVEHACKNAYINPPLACTRCCYAIRLLHVGPAGSIRVRTRLLSIVPGERARNWGRGSQCIQSTGETINALLTALINIRAGNGLRRNATQPAFTASSSSPSSSTAEDHRKLDPEGSEAVQ